MHPPFGFALFYLRSVAPPSIKTTDIYWGAIPFVCIQIIMVALIVAVPGIVSYGEPTSKTKGPGDGSDLGGLMQQQGAEGASGAGTDPGAELLKQLQGK